MARRLADNITTDHLSCPICRDTLTDPRVLPCDHTICLTCLTQLIQSSRKINKFACPVDRREITAPSYGISSEEWAKSFPTDDLALLLIQAISGNDKPRPKSGIPCSDHPNEFCEFFCFGCSKLVCSECAVEKHKHSDCNCKSLSKCNDSARDSLKNVSDEIEKLISFGEDIISGEYGKDQVLIQSRNQIQTTIFQLKKIIQDFEKRAFQQFVEILGKIDAVTDVEKIRKQTETTVLQLKLLRNEVEVAQSYTSTTDILSVLTEIPQKLQRFTDSLYSLGVSEEPIKLQLEINNSFLKLCEKLVEQSVGTVHVVPEDSLEFEDTEAIVCGQSIKFATNVLPSLATELEPYLAIKPDPCDKSLATSPRFTGLVIHGHSIIAVDNANSKIQRFRDKVENQFVDEVSLSDVYGITLVSNSDDILVTCPGKCPRVLRLSTYSGLCVITEVVTKQAYYSICQLSGNKYAVICHSVKNKCPYKKVHFQWSRGVTSHIDIINIDCHVLTSLSETLLCEPNEFGVPFVMPLKGVCGLPNGNIVISIETKSNTFVTCATQSGRIKWTYTLSDIPEGVCCHGDSIYIYLRESKLVRVLSFEGDLKPISTLRLPNYDGDGNMLLATKTFLAVADMSDTIRIYNIP